MAEHKPNRDAPGEVRSNLQVVVRVVLVIVVIALLVGLGFALVRLLNRPDAVASIDTVASIISTASTLEPLNISDRAGLG